jgi:hypothetical protein
LRIFSASSRKDMLPAYRIASTTASSMNGTPHPNQPDCRMMSSDSRLAYRSLTEAYEMHGAMTSGCRLTTVVEPHGITFSRPSAARLVMIPADWGKKHGHRASSLSVIRESGTVSTAIPSLKKSALKAIVPAEGNA